MRSRPELQTIGGDILTGREASPIPAEIIAGLRSQVLGSLGGPTEQRRRTVWASTPIHANVIQAWGRASSQHFLQLVRPRCPAGLQPGHPQRRNLPTVEPDLKATDMHQDLYRSLEGWQNYASAEEERSRT